MDENKELNSLLEELKENRKSLHDMLDDISDFRKNLDVLMPSKQDFRNKFVMQEKMRSVTEILKGELAIRGQIDSSIKLEIDIRKKSTDDEIEDLPSQIRMYAKAIELLEDKKDKTAKSLKIIKNEDINAEENKK